MSNENEPENLIDEVQIFLNQKKAELEQLTNELADTDESQNFSPPPSERIELDFIDPFDWAVSKAVSYCETYFWENTELPTFTKLMEMGLEIEDIKKYVNPKLKGRGIPEYSFNKVSVKYDNEFDPRFVLSCNVMCRASSKSKGAKFKDLSTLGVTEPMWNAWLSIPSYFEYAKKLMEIQFESVTDLDAKMGLARNVANGDLQSIKYFHEFTNRYRPQDANAVNLMGLIAALLEILSRNVTAEVFDKIADELDRTPVGELMKAS